MKLGIQRSVSMLWHRLKAPERLQLTFRLDDFQDTVRSHCPYEFFLQIGIARKEAMLLKALVGRTRVSNPHERKPHMALFSQVVEAAERFARMLANKIGEDLRVVRDAVRRVDPKIGKVHVRRGDLGQCMHRPSIAVAFNENKHVCVW